MQTQEGNWRALLSGKNAAYSLALSGGVALHAINIYIATTVLPSVIKEIGGLNLYAWNTTLFVIASILGSTLTAKLLDIVGSRKSYTIASILFMIGSLICALATNMPIMLIGRTIQGLGGGFLFALSYTMIYTVFDERLWPRAMALISGMWGIATLLGPALGGIFAEMDAWRAAFGILIPITLLYLMLVWLVLPEREHNNPTNKLPIPQLVLLITAVLVISIGSMSQSQLWNIAGIVLASIIILVFIRKEFTNETKLLPKNALRLNSPLLTLYMTIGLLVIAMTSETFVPYFLQKLHAQTPLASGYLAALMAAGWTISEIFSSGYKNNAIRKAIISGPILVLLGMLILAFSMPYDNQSKIILGLICIGLILVGFGIGLGWPHLLTRILQVAPIDDKDSAATSITTIQLFATALGSALAGMITNLGGLNVQGGLEGTSTAAFWLFIILAITPLIAIFSSIRVSRMFNKQL